MTLKLFVWLLLLLLLLHLLCHNLRQIVPRYTFERGLLLFTFHRSSKHWKEPIVRTPQYIESPAASGNQFLDKPAIFSGPEKRSCSCSCSCFLFCFSSHSFHRLRNSKFCSGLRVFTKILHNSEYMDGFDWGLWLWPFLVDINWYFLGYKQC